MSSYLYTSSYRETELKTTVYIFLRCQTESKTIVKENIIQNSSFQELQDGTGMD